MKHSLADCLQTGKNAKLHNGKQGHIMLVQKRHQKQNNASIMAVFSLEYEVLYKKS